MPLYEFQCPICKRKAERYETFDDFKPLPTCPNCGEEMKRAVVQPFHTIFKGKGWTRRNKC